MYKKPKNKVLFIIYILIIIIILALFIVSVINLSKKETEEYKISPNTVFYDENYSYTFVDKEANINKKWNGKYYLSTKSEKYSLGVNSVLYNLPENKLDIYGEINQVFTNGNIVQKKGNTSITNFNEFQFFKLGDRRYLVVYSNIESKEITASNYLMVVIDKSGDAFLMNDKINIKTVNPLVFTINDIKFDVANEKLIMPDTEIDLKRINGSTNGYIPGEKNLGDNEVDDKQSSGNGSGSSSESQTQSKDINIDGMIINNQIYNNIVKQFVNLKNISSSKNRTPLYKNVALRTLEPGFNFIDVTYSVIDPEQKYLSTFLKINGVRYDLPKEDNKIRIDSLDEETIYVIELCYTTETSVSGIVADTMVVSTTSNPTTVDITELDYINQKIKFRVKTTEEVKDLNSEIVAQISNCIEDSSISSVTIDLVEASSDKYFESEFDKPESSFACIELYSDGVKLKNYSKIKLN